MTLAELITALEAADPDRVVPHGFTNPHSYCGYYHELAFEPAANVTVSDMLEDARLALGSTYQGWKGGDFTMSEHTECWLSMEGCASGDTISKLLLQLMLAEPPPAAAEALPATTSPMSQPEPLTDQQIDEIQARFQVATPGPWERHEEYGPHFFANISGPYLRGVGTLNFGDGEDAEADEEFVKHAVEDVRALLAEVDRLKGQRKFLLGQLARKDAASGEGGRALREFLGAEVSAETAAPAPAVAPLAASQPSEAPVEGETAARPPTGRLRDSAGAEVPDEAVIHASEIELEGGDVMLQELSVGDPIEIEKQAGPLRPGIWVITAFETGDRSRARVRRLTTEEIHAARRREAVARIYE